LLSKRTGVQERVPDISFILPFRNEGKFLTATLNTLEKQVLNDVCAEIILVDGMSTDNSRSIAEEYVRKSCDNLRFRFLDNTRITTPAAFNIGIRESEAPIIGFGGAHCLYPPHYLQLAVRLLRIVDASVVGGGHDRILPSGDGIISEAISCLYQSPVGAAIAPYHRLRKPSYVDTVYGGFYRREVFDQVGCFNEVLVKNQDNEFNSRVLAGGFKIYYHPDLFATYIQKTDLSSFIKRAFSNGYYHPTTWRVNPRSFKFRHAVPSGLVVYLISLALAELVINLPVWALVPLVLYLVMLFSSGVHFMLKKSPLVGATTVPVFLAHHLLYGLGTIAGLFPRRTHISPKTRLAKSGVGER